MHGVKQEPIKISPRDYDLKAPAHGKIKSTGELPPDVIERAKVVGISKDELKRAGLYFQMDHSVLCACAKEVLGVEAMAIEDAMDKYDWLKDYVWRAVRPDADEFTSAANKSPHHGYFIRSKPGAKAEFPLQACLFIGTEGIAQNVHNVIIAEENSELHIITGCTSGQNIRRALHVGVSEIYVKRGAKLIFTMAHSWGEGIAVRPRTGAILEDDAAFISNYICTHPVGSLQMYPTAYCNGKNSKARFLSVLSASDGSDMDVGARVFLSGSGSRAESISRAISRGGGVIVRGHMVGDCEDGSGHIECRGLMLSDAGYIHAVPELEARVSSCMLSHEAAVGKINEEEIAYLMSRGLREDEAASAIVRGFMDIDMPGLPDTLKAELLSAGEARGGAV